MWATHYAPAADLLQQQKLDRTPWKSKPNWFIVAKNDHTVHPDLQRFLAKRMGATTVEADSSHVIMLSKPDVVIDVIRKAVAAVQKADRKKPYSPRLQEGPSARRRGAISRSPRSPGRNTFSAAAAARTSAGLQG